MSTITKQALSGFLALGLSAVLLPGAADAQEQEQEKGAEQRCSAQLTPASVQAGQAAVQLDISFSSDIGQVENFEAADSGLELADPADIAQTGMAREGGEEEPQPIVMSQGEQVGATVWLNTEDASPGTYELKVKGQNGACTSTLQVSEAQPMEGEDAR